MFSSVAPPQNVMLYGKAGLGKTAVTTYMMEALQDEVTKRPDADDVHVHELNCNGKVSLHCRSHSGQRTVTRACKRVPETWSWTADAFEELYTQLDRIGGGTHLVVFDEIDHLDDVDTLLYELPRARSIGHITNSKVGVIGISNKQLRFGSRSRRR